jgi:hypothetical protein
MNTLMMMFQRAGVRVRWARAWMNLGAKAWMRLIARKKKITAKLVSVLLVSAI